VKIKSLQVGKPITVEFNGKQVTTSIFKDQINGPVMLKTLNIVGDAQADLSVHGGHDKALYAYALDIYPKWQVLRPNDTFTNGVFGENLSLDTLPEDKIFIGDIYKLGEAIVQVTQPRFPCYKLGVKFRDIKIIKQFMKLEHPGVYFRVLKEGLINIGDELKLVEQEKILLSVLELFQIQHSSELNFTRILEIAKISSLPDEWKSHFQTILNSSEEVFNRE
jgi:MOSC domain-containing protein YiiM